MNEFTEREDDTADILRGPPSDIDDGWGDSPIDTREPRDPPDAVEARIAATEAPELRDAGPVGAAQAQRVAEARTAVEEAIREQPNTWDLPDPVADVDLPIAADDIAKRTDLNRIDLADDVPWTARSPDYGGYLDVVLHGNEYETEARVDGTAVPLTLSETAQLVESSPSWEHRPIRLLSCSTGKEEFAQDLADLLDVPVYAPDDLLQVSRDGSLHVLHDGSWRRFEPGRRFAR